MSGKRKCADEILLALRELGPSTIELLALVTEIPKKDLRQSIGILKRKGIVDMLVGGDRLFFYQINQSKQAREEAARVLGSSAHEFIRPLLRRQDRYHDQWCEFWSWKLRRAFPRIEIVREFQINSNEIAASVLQLKQVDYELMPDFLMFLPSASGGRVTIAFEIERTRKSDKRLLRKFKRYMEETRIDGLVYVCDSGRLSETIRSLYETKLLESSTRIRHYAENFFLFSDSLSGGTRPLESFFNSNAKPTSILTWCDTLCTTSRTARRDAYFKHA
ncbi:MAG: hypothetical protein EOP06_16555 [Proteobacteria bacterium]|nr:MAG: hypothetical protein EOP06_16555 [Pseudomonadota bacterium]